MATIVELTQVQVAQETSYTGPIGQYWIEGSETPISLDQAYLIGVSKFWDSVGKRYLKNVVHVYLSTKQMSPIVVTDSYATIVGYITANT